MKAIPKVQIDNKFVKVTEWCFPPNSETGMHIHAMDYVVVPMTSGILTIESKDNKFTEADLTVGQSYSRNAGVHHNVINKNEYESYLIKSK